MTKRLLRRSFLVRILSFAALVAANGIISTHVSLQMGKSGFSVPSIGFVQAAYYVGLAIGSPLAVALIARIGERRLFALYMAASVAISLAHLAYVDLAFWSMLRLLMGGCLAGVFTSMESGLHAAVSNDVRGRLFAFYQLATYASISSGQFLLSATSGTGIDAFVLTATVLFAALLSSLARVRECGATIEKPQHFSKASFSDYLAIWERCFLSVVVAVLSGILVSSFYTLLPAAAFDFGLKEQDISAFIGFAVGTTLLSLWPVARLSDRFGRPLVLLFISLVICASSAIILAYPGPDSLSTWGLAYSAAIFCVYGQATSDANDRLPSSTQGAAAAMILASYSLGGCLGPIATSLLMDRLGKTGYFSVVLGTGIILSVCTLFAMLQRRRASGVPPGQ